MLLCLIILKRNLIIRHWRWYSEQSWMHDLEDRLRNIPLQAEQSLWCLNSRAETLTLARSLAFFYLQGCLVRFLFLNLWVHRWNIYTTSSSNIIWTAPVWSWNARQACRTEEGGVFIRYKICIVVALGFSLKRKNAMVQNPPVTLQQSSFITQTCYKHKSSPYFVALTV